MPEVKSTKPLLRGNKIVIPSPGPYQNLFTIQTDPQIDLHIGHIRIDISDATTLPYINFYLNGKPYLENFPLIGTSYQIDYGRHVVLERVDKAIRIEMKTTAAGTGALTATALVDGLEVPKQ